MEGKLKIVAINISLVSLLSINMASAQGNAAASSTADTSSFLEDDLGSGQGQEQGLKDKVKELLEETDNTDYLLNKLELELKQICVKNEELHKEYESVLDIPIEDRKIIYRELGDAYTKKGSFGLAIKSYNALLETEPNNARAHYSLGLLYQYHGRDTGKALYHLKRSLKGGPDFKLKKDAKYLIEMLKDN